MELIDQQVTGKFKKFQTEQDATRVWEALDAIEAFERDIPVGGARARSLAVSRRLEFFAKMDQVIDPSWDPKQVPVQGVPPPANQGIVYPSGEVDPVAIPDPDVRARYVAALKANKADRKRYDCQLELRAIDNRAVRFFELFLTNRYSNSLEDRHEFGDLLNASPVNEVRKARLRALIRTLPQG